MTRVSIQTGTVGPLHDPYGRETISVTRHEVLYEIQFDALGGDSYFVDGKPIFRNNWDEQAYNQFVKDTGAEPYQWEMWYYDRICPEIDDPYGPLSQYI